MTQAMSSTVAPRVGDDHHSAHQHPELPPRSIYRWLPTPLLDTCPPCSANAGRCCWYGRQEATTRRVATMRATAWAVPVAALGFTLLVGGCTSSVGSGWSEDRESGV